MLLVVMLVGVDFVVFSWMDLVVFVVVVGSKCCSSHNYNYRHSSCCSDTLC